MITEAANEPSGAHTTLGHPLPWYRVWFLALTRPRVATFSELAGQPGAKASRAFLWVFLAGCFDFLGATFVQVILVPIFYPGNSAFEGTFLGRSVLWVCAFPLYGVLFLLGFMLMAALMQWLARALGGSGTFDQLAFVLGALAAPFSIITAVLLPFVAIPYVGLCFGLLTLVLSIYILGLQVPAIMGVNRLGWDKASIALILPGIVVGLPALVILFAL